jgi:hypothetical protein
MGRSIDGISYRLFLNCVEEHSTGQGHGGGERGGTIGDYGVIHKLQDQLQHANWPEYCKSIVISVRHI